MPYTLTRTTAGLVLRDDFADAAPYALGAGWVQGPSPGFVCFGHTPLDLLLPGTSPSSDYGGVREFQLYNESAAGSMLPLGTYSHLLYGAGDGTSGAGGYWRPQYATATDGWLTVTRHGNLLSGNGIAPGGDGSQDARDVSFGIEKRGSTYYAHLIYTPSSITVPGGKGYIPGGPYNCDVFSSPALGPSAAWTFLRVVATSAFAGTQTGNGAYACQLFSSPAGGYRLTLAESSSGSANSFNVATLSGSSPGGPFASTGTQLFAAGAGSVYAQRQGENPKAWFWDALGCWVLTANGVSTLNSGVTNTNFYFTSDKPSDFTAPGVNGQVFNRVCPADGANAVGIVGPFVGPEGVVCQDQGYVPVTYDSDPDGTVAGGSVATGRRGRFAVLEPSRTALGYTPQGGAGVVFTDSFPTTGALAGYNGWAVDSTGAGTPTVQAAGTLSMGGGSGGASLARQTGVTFASGSVTYNTAAAPGVDVGVVLRWQNASNYYFVDVTSVSSQAQVGLYLYSGGVLTQPGASQTVNVNLGSVTGITVACSGSTFTVTVGAASPVSWTDATISAAGQFGFRNGGNAAGGAFVKATVSVSSGSGGSDSVHLARRAQAHGDFTAEFALEYDSTSGAVTGLGWDYRVQASGDSYRVSLVPGAGLALQKSTGGSGGVPGTYATLASSSGTLVGVPGTTHRVKVKAAGNAHTLTLDGEQQVSYTDASSPYTSGASLGTAFAGVVGRVRCLHLRTADAVTLTGLTAGQLVTFRAAGGIPVETATATGATYTTTSLTHYPIHSVDVAGVNYPIPGLGWGGDTLALTAVGGGTYTAAANVRSGTDRGDGTLGTLVVPSAGTVLSTATFDNGTVGTVVLPAANKVAAGTAFGPGSATTGTYAVTLPSATDVRAGTAYGSPQASATGSLAVPAAAQVLAGVPVDAGTGTVALPAASTVEAGVHFGPSSSLTGTYDPVTGQYTDPGVGHVQAGVTYTFAGSLLTGTFVAAPPTSPVPYAVCDLTESAPGRVVLDGPVPLPAAADLFVRVTLGASESLSLAALAIRTRPADQALVAGDNVDPSGWAEPVRLTSFYTAGTLPAGSPNTLAANQIGFVLTAAAATALAAGVGAAVLEVRRTDAGNTYPVVPPTWCDVVPDVA